MFKSGNKAKAQDVQSGAQASGPEGFIKLEDILTKPYPKPSRFHTKDDAETFLKHLAQLEDGDDKLVRLTAGIKKAHLYATKGKTAEARQKGANALAKAQKAKADLERSPNSAA